MRTFRLAILLFCVAALSTVGPAQTTPKQALLVLSKTNHTLAIVNPATLKVVARVYPGGNPDGLAWAVQR